MSLGKKIESFDPAKKVGGMLDEFKAFAFKGNMIDLAIGVIIGAAFGKIIDSLVKNIVMPLISLVIPGNQGYQNWQLAVTETVDKNGNTIPDKVIPYGLFLAEVVNFLIVAFVLFFFFKKFLGWALRSKQQAPPPPTKDQELLTEIRDLLKQKASA
jgi:large conductance mechanosensitive channel